MSIYGYNGTQMYPTYNGLGGGYGQSYLSAGGGNAGGYNYGAMNNLLNQSLNAKNQLGVQGLTQDYNNTVYNTMNNLARRFGGFDSTIASDDFGRANYAFGQGLATLNNQLASSAFEQGNQLNNQAYQNQAAQERLKLQQQQYADTQRHQQLRDNMLNPYNYGTNQYQQFEAQRYR